MLGVYKADKNWTPDKHYIDVLIIKYNKNNFFLVNTLQVVHASHRTSTYLLAGRKKIIYIDISSEILFKTLWYNLE